MKVSGIDEDFVEIIDYLNKNGFKPWSSCDGVESHHSKENKPDKAYIAFLSSEKIMDLMAAFLRDKEMFEVSISSNSHVNPYDYFGNIISGNTYQVYFENKRGELTNYFERIIKGVNEKSIDIKEEEKEQIKKVAEFLNKTEDSELQYDIHLNGEYQPYMRKDGKTNSITIMSKEELEEARNMEECSKLISEKFGIPIKEEGYSESFDDVEEFVVAQKSYLQYFFKGEDLSRALEIIEFVNSQEKNLDTFKMAEPDFDDYDF